MCHLKCRLFCVLVTETKQDYIHSSWLFHPQKPPKVALSDVRQLVASESAFAALLGPSGDVFCWGDGEMGRGEVKAGRQMFPKALGKASFGTVGLHTCYKTCSCYNLHMCNCVIHTLFAPNRRFPVVGRICRKFAGNVKKIPRKSLRNPRNMLCQTEGLQCPRAFCDLLRLRCPLGRWSGSGLGRSRYGGRPGKGRSAGLGRRLQWLFVGFSTPKRWFLGRKGMQPLSFAGFSIPNKRLGRKYVGYLTKFFVLQGFSTSKWQRFLGTTLGCGSLCSWLTVGVQPGSAF